MSSTKHQLSYARHHHGKGGHSYMPVASFPGRFGLKRPGNKANMPV